MLQSILFNTFEKLNIAQIFIICAFFVSKIRIVLNL